MKVLLEFDFFYTMIEIPDRFNNLCELDSEFEIWARNSLSQQRIDSQGRQYVFFDDDTFIDWLKRYKLKPDESVKIKYKHIAELSENMLDYDGKIYF